MERHGKKLVQLLQEHSNTVITQIRPLDMSYDIQSNGCWFWLGNRDSDGYGLVSVKRNGWQKSKEKAHRLFWMREHGLIQSGMVIRHKCDTPCCVNPDHLLVGTVKDNSRDAVERGRVAHGERHPYFGKRRPEHIAIAVSESNRRRNQPRDEETGMFVRIQKE